MISKDNTKSQSGLISLMMLSGLAVFCEPETYFIGQIAGTHKWEENCCLYPELMGLS